MAFKKPCGVKNQLAKVLLAQYFSKADPGSGSKRLNLNLDHF